jgi:hypothetical protein
MTKTEKFGLRWPVTVIDFEASSLEEGSYPIEVAVGIWNGQQDPIRLWSTLIRPASNWSLNGHWSRKSERVHGISRANLANGKDPSDIVHILNGRVSARIAWCDGGPYDTYWLRTLYEAAGCVPPFSLMDLDGLTVGRAGLRERLYDHLQRTPARHRAGEDVLRLLRALASAIGAKVSVVRLDDN